MRHIPMPHPWREAPAGVTRDARTSKSVVLPICDALGLNRSFRSTNKKGAQVSPFLIGGEGGIRTLDELPHTPLAGERLQPLGHLSTAPSVQSNCSMNQADPAGAGPLRRRFALSESAGISLLDARQLLWEH